LGTPRYGASTRRQRLAQLALESFGSKGARGTSASRSNTQSDDRPSRPTVSAETAGPNSTQVPSTSNEPQEQIRMSHGTSSAERLWRSRGSHTESPVTQQY